MRFLVTGFAPFGNSSINPSYEAVRRLPDTLGEHRIYHAELPVVYGQCGEILCELMDRVKPDCVLCFGQAAGREGLSLENTAVNVKASSSPDNAGVTFSGEKIDPEGPESRRARLQLKELCAELKDAGFPVKISFSAGTYVCNDLFYEMLRYAEESGSPVMCGFIHIPADESQAADFAPGTPFMSIHQVVEAAKLMIEFLGNTVPGTF